MSEVQVMGLVLRANFEDGQPRVLDVELGKQLGMAQPRDIRRTIEKFAEDLRDFGDLSRERARCAQSGNRVVESYWLNKDQAIFVAGRERR